MLRWVSPDQEHEPHGHRATSSSADSSSSEGDKALMLYESANFDEAQFDDPSRFDIDALAE